MKKINLVNYFQNPSSQRQKQYELVRAIIIDELPINEASKKFNYKLGSVYSLLRDAKNGKIELFPQVKKGPQKIRTSEEVVGQIISLRKKFISTTDIESKLKGDGIDISARTVERILKNDGFKKLKRRTYKELGITKKNKIIPERSEELNLLDLKKFQVDCPSVGIFFFIPYIIESGILDIVKKCDLPESSEIGSVNACMAMLLLKLIGKKRLSHIGAFDKEVGLGVFASLNVLPKPTYMCTYSCRVSENSLMNMQEEILTSFKEKYPDLYKGEYINLDFHSIPHYGDESEMEKVWCGAKGKAIKGANTVFAQDGESNAILYTRADILRNEEANEVKKFVSYWRKIKNEKIDETLVFDCKFTSYEILDELENDNIKFITLRKRNSFLLKETEKIPNKEWKKVNINIPKRKYNKVSVCENQVLLSGCKNRFRQIIIKDHGRNNPTYIITNNAELSMKKLLEVYAKRWRIENKISEMVTFFNLNALSSPIMIRIHFDILWTMIADTLYHLFARDLRRFEKELSPTIFRKFIDMPGKIVYDGDKFIIKIRKRSHTPILLGVEKLQAPIKVPWLDNKTIQIDWTA